MSDGVRFAVLASGRGSNAYALAKAFATGFIPAQLAVILADRPQAPVLARARALGVPHAVVPRHAGREAHEAALLRALETYRIDHLLLAGYMRLLSQDFLQRFAGKVLNIHPALLPEFPGLNAAQRQYAAGRTVVGATVHFVDEGIDTGPVLLQGSTLRQPGDSEADVVQRLLRDVEHVIYPRAVRLFVERGEAK